MFSFLAVIVFPYTGGTEDYEVFKSAEYRKTLNTRRKLKCMFVKLMMSFFVTCMCFLWPGDEIAAFSDHLHASGPNMCPASGLRVWETCVFSLSPGVQNVFSCVTDKISVSHRTPNQGSFGKQPTDKLAN